MKRRHKSTRPTWRQKKLIYGKVANPANWLILSESKEVLTLKHKFTDTLKEVQKAG